MTASDRQWTDTDVELVGDALHDYLTGLGLPPEMVRPYGAAEAVLTALADAGRLVPEDVTNGEPGGAAGNATNQREGA